MTDITGSSRTAGTIRAPAVLMFERTFTLPLAVFVFLLVVIAILGLIIWSVKRRRDAKLAIGGDGDLETLIPSLVGLTHGTLLEGNRIELLQDGDGFYPIVIDTIRQATRSVHFETFLWKKGELSRRLSAALAERAKAGVEVRVLVDGSGGKGLKGPDLRNMLEAGVEFARFHPLRVSNLGLINNRDHRKIVVIDGRTAFLGGHCIVDSWLGTAQDRKHFRDISIRVEGPVVHQIQSAFAENWIEETGKVPSGEAVFPELEPAGEAAAHLVYVTPDGYSSSVKLMHYFVIHAASRSITIQNPYFLPDPDAIRALIKAASRGVSVRVMLPSADASDFALVQHASHHRFGALLEGGVRIFEYHKTLLHQKVLTVDGVWSAVGSTNFDDRAFEINDEVSLGILDATLARQLEETFESDLADCRELKASEWKQRSLGHRLLDIAAFSLNEQL